LRLDCRFRRKPRPLPIASAAPAGVIAILRRGRRIDYAAVAVVLVAYQVEAPDGVAPPLR
jgi:hypothetical protein